jgi:hypothetical protein
MTNKLYKVFTHGDLDGAVSLLCLLWSKPEATIEYEELYNNTIEERLLNYSQKTINKPTTIIMDFSLRESFLNFDLSEYVFLDHHKISERYVDKFKNAKIIYKNSNSNTGLVYSTFNKTLSSLSKEQKYLIALADDFDSYSLKLPHSYDLNILFWTEYKNKFSKFIQDYSKGFKHFTENQTRLINFEKNSACEQASKLKKFEGELLIKGERYKTLAVTGEKYNNLVIDCLIRENNPDLFFYINTKTEKVNLRKKSTITSFDLGTFAEKICEGGGNTNSAGGKLTPLFMELTKNLKPV